MALRSEPFFYPSLSFSLLSDTQFTKTPDLVNQTLQQIGMTEILDKDRLILQGRINPDTIGKGAHFWGSYL